MLPLPGLFSARVVVAPRTGNSLVHNRVCE